MASNNPMHTALKINRHLRWVEEILRSTRYIPLNPPSSTSRCSRPVIRVVHGLMPLCYDLDPLPLRPRITSPYVLEKFVKKAIERQDIEVMFYLLPRAPACSIRRILHRIMRERKPGRLEFLRAVARSIGPLEGFPGSDEKIPCACVTHAVPDFEMTLRGETNYDRCPRPIRYEDLTDLEQNILTTLYNVDFAQMYALLTPLRYRDVRNLLMYTVELDNCAVMCTLAQAIDLDKSDGDLLVYTIRRGRCRHKLQGLLAAGFPADCRVYDDLPALMLKMPSLEHYQILLGARADPNLRYERRDSRVKTAFMAAMMRGNLNLMTILLNCKANIDDVVGKSDFVFELACTPHFNISLISLLLDQGLDINVCNKHGETLVHAALLHSNYELMCLLIERGADVNIADRDGVTPLIRSAKKGKTFTDRLLAAGADINAVDRWSRNVAVAWMFEGNEKAVVELLDRGANCNIRNDDWGTPVILAMRLTISFNKALDKMLFIMSSNETAKRDFIDYQAVGVPSALCQAVVDMCQGDIRSIRTVEILLQHGASWDKDPDLKDVLIHAIVSVGDLATFQAALNRYIKPRDCSVQKLRSCLNMPIVSCCTDKVSPLYVALYFGYWPLAEFMLKINYLTPSDTGTIAGHSCLYQHLCRFACFRTLEVLEDIQKQPLSLEALTMIIVSDTFCKDSCRDLRELGLPITLLRALAYEYDTETVDDSLAFGTSERGFILGLNTNYICPCPVKGPFFQ